MLEPRFPLLADWTDAFMACDESAPKPGDTSLRRPPLLLLAALPFLAAGERPVHQFDAIGLSPDGTRIASIESDDVPRDGDAPVERLLIRDLDGNAHDVTPSCARAPGCRPSSPTWNEAGTALDFLVEQSSGRSTIETVGRDGGQARVLVDFDGPLDQLRFGPGDRLAVLATAHAHKRIGATQAAARMAGEIGTVLDEQRIAIVDHAALRFVSPPALYVYEYAWQPKGGFVGTAAAGNGDSNWWIARLYAFDEGSTRILFAPGPREQLADPVVSPDGHTVDFIGGWMSDFGSTGGDAYALALDRPGTAPVDLTGGARASTTALDWHCRDGLTAISIAGSRTTISSLDGPAPHDLWSGEDAIGADRWNAGLACNGGRSAAIVQSFTRPPDIVAGPIGAWRPVTHANRGIAAPGTARSVQWTDDGLTVQGWLLLPRGDPALRRPMIVDVHGGPQAAATPEFPGRGMVRDLLAAGDDVFMPNYRGSFGQGERFAAASIGDLGGGDWRDVLTGVDAAERAAPIDDHRLGIEGGSYGGYMTMWAVTQTHRFRAGAADAGVSDWLSIEGEAPQAGSDAVSFGGSVYDNIEPYLRASPITHMRGVVTPMLITVGDRDVECPMPQSQEFYTALSALGVPASFVVYKDEGHAIIKEADRTDLRRRTIAWFQKWLG